nr:MAG TPA: hypothetical protein [Caudoviricetes sp.]
MYPLRPPSWWLELFSKKSHPPSSNRLPHLQWEV